MNYFINCFRKYINFKTRARRSEFWYFVLFGFIALCLLAGLDFLLKTAVMRNGIWAGGFMFYFGAVFMFLPFCGVASRRLHDTGKKEYWVFVMLLTFFGLGGGFIKTAQVYGDTHSGFSLVLMLANVFVWVFFMTWFVLAVSADSEPVDNIYGEYPKKKTQE